MARKMATLMIFINLEKCFNNINWKMLFDIIKTGGTDIKNRKSLNKKRKKNTTTES